jgi:hypothetical protein
MGVFPLLTCSFWVRSEVVDPDLITGHNWVQTFGSFSLVSLQNLTATKHLSLCSGDRSRGTHLVLTLLTFNSLCRLSSTLPTLIPTSCNSSRTVMRRLARISSPIFKMLSGLKEVLGRRAWGSFSSWSCPSRNDFAQLNTLGCDKHSSPNCLKPGKDFRRNDTFLREKFDNYTLRITAGYFLLCHLDCTWWVRQRGIRLVWVSSLNVL